jgi:hypothetical protein
MSNLFDADLEKALTLLAKAEGPGACADDWLAVHKWINKHGKDLLIELRRLRAE